MKLINNEKSMKIILSLNFKNRDEFFEPNKALTRYFSNNWRYYK